MFICFLACKTQNFYYVRFKEKPADSCSRVTAKNGQWRSHGVLCDMSIRAPTLENLLSDLSCVYPSSAERTGDGLVRPNMLTNSPEETQTFSVRKLLRPNFTLYSGKTNQICARLECYFRKLIMYTDSKLNTWSHLVSTEVRKS